MSCTLVLNTDHFLSVDAQNRLLTPPPPLVLATVVQKTLAESNPSETSATVFESKKELFINCRKNFQIKIRRAIKKAVYLYHAKAAELRSLVPQYQSEFFDKQHRYGKQLEPFFKVWKESTTTDDFNSWMEKLDTGADVPGKAALTLLKLLNEDGTPIAIPKVEYISPNQLHEYELQVGTDGRIFTKQSPSAVFHSPDSTKESAFGFVISAEKKLYVAPYKRGTFNHSSFLAGKPVLCAGMILCDNGKVTTLWDDSGHYNVGHYHIVEQLDSPSKRHMLTALNTFKDKGVDITSVSLMINEINNGKWVIAKLTATEFLSQMSPLVA